MYENLKQKLISEKERLEGELRSYKAEDPYLAQDRDLETNTIDNDSTENESHDRIAATRNSMTEDLSAVLLALEKFDRGTYGKCERGRDHEVELERLQATPTARFCMAHAG